MIFCSRGNWPASEAWVRAEVHAVAFARKPSGFVLRSCERSE